MGVATMSIGLSTSACPIIATVLFREPRLTPRQTRSYASGQDAPERMPIFWPCHLGYGDDSD